LRLTGVIGRIGEAVKVHGMFLHPGQAAAALAAVDGLLEYRLVVGRVDHVDTLRCEIVVAPALDPSDVAGVVRDRIRAWLRLSSDVVPVPALPDGPAVLDERDWDG
jgi:phenylacetate-CoA ligase